jgi:phosphotriesterase-related protein
MNVDDLSEYIVTDAQNVNAGIIKCAVENENISPFNEKLLRACAKAHLKLNLPIVMHTNANNKNGTEALEIILSEGVKPQAVTVSHLSDTSDIQYIKSIAENGCYIGLDRLYNNTNEDYINKKLGVILTLCDFGYKDKIILSHDELFFNGFEANPQIKSNTRFDYVFKYILPRLEKEIADEIIRKNPIRMLKCQEG